MGTKDNEGIKSRPIRVSAVKAVEILHMKFVGGNMTPNSLALGIKKNILFMTCTYYP